MQVPRCRQGVARLARLLPQDRPWRRHELEGVISHLTSTSYIYMVHLHLARAIWRAACRREAEVRELRGHVRLDLLIL